MTWKTALLALLSSLGFFGLAVLGAGGWNDFVSKPPLVAVLLIGAALAVAGMFTQGNLSSGEKEDRGNRWVLWAFGILGALMAWLPAYTDRMNIAVIGGDSVRWIGVVLFALGGVLRIWPVFTLGKRFSGLVAIQPGHELVTRICSSSRGSRKLYEELQIQSGTRIIFASVPLIPKFAFRASHKPVRTSESGQ
jgi:hypothetical protein